MMAANPAGSAGGGIFQTSCRMNPENNQSVVLMSRAFPSQHRQDLYNGFEERVN